MKIIQSGELISTLPQFTRGRKITGGNQPLITYQSVSNHYFIIKKSAKNQSTVTLQMPNHHGSFILLKASDRCDITLEGTCLGMTK